MNLLKPLRAQRRAYSARAGLAMAACLVVVGCGSSTASHPSTSTTQSAGGVTLKTASVGGLGTVLVDGQGRTLYTLTSELHGAITCTTASGCTQVWGELDLGKGHATARTRGATQPSLLGTETGAAGGRLVTYGGWPLYTFAGDTAPGQANGQKMVSFGGTWFVLSSSGRLVKSAAHSSSPTPSSGGNGY
jgi:predicted lipoprotein with Yx(FWY)xxD motif